LHDGEEYALVAAALNNFGSEATWPAVVYRSREQMMEGNPEHRMSQTDVDNDLD
jgi:hypothetical protein